MQVASVERDPRFRGRNRFCIQARPAPPRAAPATGRAPLTAPAAPLRVQVACPDFLVAWDLIQPHSWCEPRPRRRPRVTA